VLSRNAKEKSSGYTRDMNKPDGSPDSFHQSYQGHCRACGEIYVVQAEDDDLDGVVFSCKKIGCVGKIALKVEDDFKIALPEKKPTTKSKFH